MMFLICDQQLETKYYLSYIGGSANDYLGKTGVPWGSNHMYYDSTKFVLYVGTTTHSLETTHNTRFVGRNPIYAPYQGLPIFDAVKSNGSNDAHLVFAIEIRSFIISVLASEWMDLKVHANAACKPVLTWSTSDEMDVSSFEIQRSYDGIHFRTIQTLGGNAYWYPYTDNQIDPQMNQAIYRIMANSHKGTQYFSDDRLFRTCKKNRPGFEVYPTWVKDHITIRDDGGRVRRTLRVVMINELGVRVQQWDFHTGEGAQVLTFNRPLSKGTYFLIIQDSERGDLLHRSRLIAMK
jgi:putative IMPACT (imprinted ancient) family translation regulator